MEVRKGFRPRMAIPGGRGLLAGDGSKQGNSNECRLFIF